MGDGWVWAAYLVTYGVILGYAAALAGRRRRQRDGEG